MAPQVMNHCGVYSFSTTGTTDQGVSIILTQLKSSKCFYLDYFEAMSDSDSITDCEVGQREKLPWLPTESVN